jgi:hypothetical protein
MRLELDALLAEARQRKADFTELWPDRRALRVRPAPPLNVSRASATLAAVITENLVRMRSPSARIADRGNFEAASKVF